MTTIEEYDVLIDFLFYLNAKEIVNDYDYDYNELVKEYIIFKINEL